MYANDGGGSGGGGSASVMLWAWWLKLKRVNYSDWVRISCKLMIKRTLNIFMPMIVVVVVVVVVPVLWAWWIKLKRVNYSDWVRISCKNSPLLLPTLPFSRTDRWNYWSAPKFCITDKNFVVICTREEKTLTQKPFSVFRWTRYFASVYSVGWVGLSCVEFCQLGWVEALRLKKVRKEYAKSWLKKSY